jgi:hypothetical protein
MLIEVHDPVNLFISFHLPSHAERRPGNGGRKVLGKREKTLPFIETIFQNPKLENSIF